MGHGGHHGLWNEKKNDKDTATARVGHHWLSVEVTIMVIL